MSSKVHAHQILGIIGRQPAPITVEQLRQQVNATFGSDLEFLNCHDDSFTFEQLVDFLQQHGKIVVNDGAVELNRPEYMNP